jgi:hypothetical protein
MKIELSKQEAWKIMDAIKTYSKDYTVSGAVNKTFSNIISKLEKVINE